MIHALIITGIMTAVINGAVRWTTGVCVTSGGTGMTVGAIIALLTKYASDTDVYLMGTNVYSIDVTDDGIIVYPVNASSSSITIANVWEEGQDG